MGCEGMKVKTGIFIGLILFLFCFVMPASAIKSADVDFLLVNPYENSKGDIINSCDDITGWSNGVINTSNQIEGTGCLQLTTQTAGSNIGTSIDTGHNFSTDQNYVFFIYIDDLDTFSTMSVRFSLANNVYKSMIWSPHGEIGRFHEGWNAFVFDKTDFTPTDVTWSDNLSKIAIYVYPKPGMNTTVFIDDIRVNYTGTPTCVMTFDDGATSVYDIAYPIMKERGLVGTCFVVPDLIGSNDAFYMNISELRELENNGWEIASHTQSHTDLTALSDANLRLQLSSSFDWLVNNGFNEKSARMLAYPGGKYDQNVIDAAEETYILARTVNKSRNEMHIQNNTDIRLALKQYEPTNLVSSDQINETLAKTVQHGGMQIFMFHRFTTGVEELRNISAANFTKMCDGIVASGTRNVLLSSYIEERAPNFSAVIGEKVTISAGGNSTVLTDNVYPDIIATMLVEPASDSVNVTISNWTSDQKVWTLSSETPQSVTHTIGGFPASTDIQIKRDDVDYETVTSNETGYIEWVYDGGFSEFSEHTFSIEIECHDFNASLTSGAYPLTTQFTTSSEGIDAYYWDFENDGIIDSTKQNPAHTYGQTGDYSVNLTVHTSEGNVSTVKPDYITVSAPAFASDPVAWFNWVFSYLFGRF